MRRAVVVPLVARADRGAAILELRILLEALDGDVQVVGLGGDLVVDARVRLLLEPDLLEKPFPPLVLRMTGQELLQRLLRPVGSSQPVLRLGQQEGALRVVRMVVPNASSAPTAGAVTGIATRTTPASGTSARTAAAMNSL